MTHGLLKVVGITALAAGIAFSQNGPGGQRGQHGRGEMFGRMGADLNLTDTQKQQMRSIFMSSHQAAQTVDDQIKQNRDALAAAVKSGAPETEIDRLSASLGPLMAQSTSIHTKAFAKFYATLTQEQKDKLGDRFMGMMNGMGGGRPGMRPSGRPARPAAN